MNTPPPSPPESRSLPPLSPPGSQRAEKPSFARQAAKFSALSPLAALGIQILGTGVARGDRTLTMFFSGVGSLLILAGIVLGLIALFGIRRHGRKGILGFALTGVLINTFLIVAAFFTFQSVKQRAEQVRQTRLQQEQEQRNP